MGRVPYKNDNEKLTESITLGLNKLYASLLDDYAKKIGATHSFAIKKILEMSDCFSHEISDEHFEKLKNKKEMFLMGNSKWIPSSELKIIRSRINKEQKKSLFYHAINLQNISPALFTRKVIESFLDNNNNFEKSPKSDNDLLKKLWENAPEEIRKEFVEDYLKKRNL